MNYFNRIEEDLNLVIALASEKYKQEIQSIFLEGSYGRGEGAFLLKDKIYYPINDYDILIVTKKSWDNQMYLDFKKLVKKMKVPRLDISILAFDKLKKKKYTLARYDLIMNSKIIYGDKNFLDVVVKFDQSKIPFREKEQLFFSRLIGLLLFKYNRSLDKHYNLQQLSKSVVSAYESNLLQNNIYSSSYKSNRDNIDNINFISIGDKDLLKQAYCIKLEPSLIDFEKINEDIFFDKSSIFVREQFYKLLKEHNRIFESVFWYNLYFWIRPRRIIQILISFITDKKYIKDLMLISVQLKIFLNQFELEEKEFRSVKKGLEIITRQKFENMEELIKYVIKTRMGWV
jgi:hypothetical protein